MIKLGITGGIGSGKSVVSELFRILGVPVYDSDREAKKITSSSAIVREKLTACFGDGLYDGHVLNKSRFASLIFSDTKNLEAANAIIHPEVLNGFLSWAGQQRTEMVAIEAAILFESGFNASVDYILTVTAPVELRISRTMRRSRMTRNEVEKRISSQLSDEYRMERSDFTIYNDYTSPLIPQVEEVYRSSFLNILKHTGQ